MIPTIFPTLLIKIDTPKAKAGLLADMVIARCRFLELCLQIGHPGLMSKSRITILAAVIILVGLVVWWSKAIEEPVYQGKTLSEWLDKFDYDSNFVHTNGLRLPAYYQDVTAIQALGTNALPVLIEDLRRHDSAFKKLVQTWARKLYGSYPVANRRTVHFFRRDFEQRRIALELLQHMGKRTSPYVPELTRMTQDSDPEIADTAVKALGAIGTNAAPAVPALLARMTNSYGSYRNNAMLAIYRTGVTNEAFFSQLRFMLNDTNKMVRGNATNILKRLTGEM